MRRLFNRFRPLTLAVAGLMLGLLAIVPTMGVAAQFYPPNTVVSSYFDPRYCGNGAVSVVTDQGGALIDICTSTGQRIVPVYPDYGYGYGYAAPAYNGYAYGYNTAPAYTAPVYTAPAYTAPVYNAGYTYGYANTAYGYNRGYYGGYTYSDNRTNCPNGQVTSTASGYFCTANGAPAFVP